MYSRLARVLGVALLAVVTFADGASVAPPTSESLRLVGRVVDGANVLSPTTEAELTHRLADFETSSGVQVVVATVPSLEGRDIAEVALELGRRWGIGAKDTDSGVVLLVAPNERRVRIEVGYGLEGDLTDAKTSRIIRNRIVPAFQRGDLDAGVRDGVDGILEVLGGEPSSPAADQPRGGTEQVRHYAPAAIFWIFFLIILFSNLGGRRRRRRRGLGDVLFWASVLGGLPHDRSGGGYRGGGGFGGGGGGGFRGGGGSFGGGGASGSW